MFIDKGRVRFLSSDERLALLERCKQSEWEKLYLIVFMAIVTGARRSELLRLTWQDIDFTTKRAIVHTSKNGDKRVLPLTQELITELRKYRGIGLLFPSDSKKGYDFDRHWKIALKASGIKDFRFHDLRHTCASYLAQKVLPCSRLLKCLGIERLLSPCDTVICALITSKP